MTNLVKHNSRLSDIINKNNILLDFLKSPLDKSTYHTSEFNYDNLLWKFHYAYESYFHLLIQSKSDLLKLRVVGKTTINELEQFLNSHNCQIGMFKDFKLNDFYSITGDKVLISQLSHTEMMISMLSIKYFVDRTPNDGDLGRLVRKVFNTTKSMILNTFIKKQGVELTKSEKSWLGRNIIRCFKSKYPDAEIKKVNISENGCKMQVIDYPREFLESENVKRIIKKFTNKYNSNKNQ